MRNISHVVIDQSPDGLFSCAAHLGNGDVELLASERGQQMFKNPALAARLAVRRFGVEVPIHLEVEAKNHE